MNSSYQIDPVVDERFDGGEDPRYFLRSLLNEENNDKREVFEDSANDQSDGSF